MARVAKPIPNHRFHELPDNSLLYILRDAAEAAAAMRGHNIEAELKYLDQINDASTILNWRRTSLAYNARKEG